MAIYLQVTNTTNPSSIQGNVTVTAYQNWSELNSFQWGISRSIVSAASGAASRESDIPSISDVAITKMCDAASLGLVQYALTGQLNGTFIIAFTTTSTTPYEYLRYEFDNVGLSNYSVSSGGDMPMESFTLNFTNVTETFTPTDPAVTDSTPSHITFNLQTMQMC
jgi:type VI secretion system secreted protein Hcp